MKKEPFISVIITYYKKKLFLRETLQSILNQSYKNYEIIFVFDDKDKNDLKFVKHNLLKFKKKKLIVNNKNLGVAKSRNIGLNYCTGRYIAFLDADDIWSPNKLADQYKFMINKKVLFSFSE